MTPKEETLKFIEKKTQKERDKWEVGEKNHFLSWKSFLGDFQSSFEIKEKSAMEFVELHQEISRLKRILKERFGYETN